MRTIPHSSRRATSERGAILIQVGVAILVLSAFAMFIVDYGVLWVSRHQAQNSADAGALAGATALARDSFTNHADNGPAKQAAHSFAVANTVWGDAPDVQMATDIRFYSDAPADFPAMCSNNDCVRVDVYRNQARGNALPTFFGGLVGVMDQGVRATAIAQAAAANASNCLKPWAVLDKWNESSGPWTPAADYDPVTVPKDTYQAPNGNDPGTSYTLAKDLGLKLSLKVGDPQDSKATFGAGWFAPVDLGGVGGNVYRDNISGCADGTYAVGGTLSVENGNMIGPTDQGVKDLVALDKNAKWDAVNKKVINSCIGPPYTCSEPGYTVSPRVVALPIVDTQMAWDAVHPKVKPQGAGNMDVKIVAILGFFVEGMSGNDVVGYLATKPDLLVSNGGSVSPSAAFLTAIRLVR
ncbi:MAG TPA: pilus assembly protein TadG-related protein [Vicinamibacterales bacterium]|jgi:Flp pilus assembly protein TadG|nr:pilus assembly protein TadG-related protein [Vicinamibacterales bacterium]